MQRSKKDRYSMTSSAREMSVGVPDSTFHH
jgi:hypothetical protein